jgi:hypothetical protein
MCGAANSSHSATGYGLVPIEIGDGGQLSIGMY